MVAFLMSLACHTPDYSVGSPSVKQAPGVLSLGDVFSEADRSVLGVEGAAVPDDIRDFLSSDPEEIRMRVDVALQRVSWGEQVTRCQLQVSFERRNYASYPPDDRFQVAVPEAEGTCAFTRFDEEPPFRDNWYVSGDLRGPEEIYLHGEQSWPLQLVTAEDGQLRYELEDCDEAAFPFSQVLSLEIPESESYEWGVPGIWVDEALVVGPDVQLTSPNDISPDSRYHGYGTDDLNVAWELSGEIPLQRGTELDHRVEIRFYNNQKHGWRGLESMICLPVAEADEMIVASEDISQFTLNDFVDQDEYVLGLSVHSIVQGLSFSDPWGESVQVRSLMSEGGMMELITSE